MNLMENGDVGIKKAKKQLMSYFKDPVPGTKIFLVENRLDTFHVNTLIESGEYAGAVIHWRLVIPEDYPFKPANGWILDDFYFDGRHHHHCYGGQGICTDYLYNFEYMSDSSEAFNGWTPGCTITSLMIAMKQFFAEHDHHPHDADEFKAEAALVVERSKKYKCKECDATAVDLFMDESAASGGEDDEGTVAGDTAIPTPHQRALRELICPVLARSPLEDDTMLIGFPVNVKCIQNPLPQQHRYIQQADRPANDRRFRSIVLRKNTPEQQIRQLKILEADLFPEFLSLEAFCTDLSIHGASIDNLNGIQLRSPLGNKYTHIIPIYLSKDHYERSEIHLKTLISVICYGTDGTKKADFDPAMFVKVYPALMNKQIVSLLKCQSYESEMLLIAFANLLRTYRYVCAKYPAVQEINDKHVIQFFNEESYRRKEWTNDLGEFLFKMAAVDRKKYPSLNFSNEDFKKVYMKECLARKPYWVHEYWNEKGVNNFFDKFFDTATKLLFNKPGYDKATLHDKCCEMLNQFFEGSQNAFRLLLFHLECLKTFVTSDFDARMDANYGLLDQDRIQAFRKSMDEIQQLSKLSEFFVRAQWPIKDSEAAIRLVMNGYKDAKKHGYLEKIM